MADLQITQEITVDLDDRSPFEYVVVKQGDKNSRIVAVTLLQNKQVFAIPTGTTARIKYYKPDGNEVLNNCTISGNKILVTYTEQMLAASGTGKGEIMLTKDSKELKSATFYTKIVSSVYKEDGFISDKEFLSLASVLNAADQASQAAATNANIAKQAATNADTATAAAQTATKNANTATTNANTATAAANKATAATNKATSDANTAASNANKATEAAQRAAMDATVAKEDADAAAGGADNAALNANNAALEAKKQAELCKDKANGHGITFTVTPEGLLNVSKED
uniref:BppU family phage baseplate upper protein n=1 Tax=Agathobacter rectalis TaxID=39491 RepID=UPI004024D68A